MRSLVKCYLTLNVVGAILSVHGRRSPRVFGFRLPGTPTAHALTIGSPLSAPPLMLMALIVAERRRRFDMVAALGAIFVCGVACEADTVAALRDPRADPLVTALVALELAVPAALFVRARSCKRSA